MYLTRRHTLIAAAAAASAPGLALAGARPFSAETVRELAAELAARPYAPPQAAGPTADYDLWRQVRPRRDRALWTDGRPFTAELLPAGYLFRRAVELFEIEDGVSRPLPFSADDYQGPESVRAALAGFAGLRIQHPINRPGVFDEIAVFQGASYFRSLGRRQGYGVSARGIALGSGRPHEEFPAFRAFWIERPQPGEEAVVLHALMDGPSLAGAYRFVIRPGDSTVFDVEATLFARREIAEVGVAAASSMYWFGPADRAGVDDFRAAVHDSDGLEIWAADGSRLWRPLVNPPRTQITRFEGDSLRGFGLMQRARAVDDYGDLEARYDNRPSLWIEPQGDWGPGAVVLVELPTRNEYADNIAAYWAPAEPLRPGRPLTLAYRLHWGADAQPRPQIARVLRTRAGEAISSGARQFAVDFAAEPGIDLAGLRGEASATAGAAGPVALTPHPEPGLVRAGFRFQPPLRGPADIDLRLLGQDGPLSETWRFRWTA